MNIIEQLKANEKPFGLMSEGMQAKAREIGQPEFEMYMKDNTWMRCGVCNNFHCKKVTDQTYRLRDGYAEKPPDDVTISRVTLEAIIEIAQKALDK